MWGLVVLFILLVVKYNLIDGVENKVNVDESERTDEDGERCDEDPFYPFGFYFRRDDRDGTEEREKDEVGGIIDEERLDLSRYDDLNLIDDLLSNEDEDEWRDLIGDVLEEDFDINLSDDSDYVSSSSFDSGYVSFL